MTDTRPNLTVTEDPERQAYVATLDDGTEAGAASYRRAGDTVVFTHTEVDPSLEGQGIGSRLVREALDHVREQGATFVAQCRFVRDYVDEHHDWDDLRRTDADPGSAAPATAE